MLYTSAPRNARYLTAVGSPALCIPVAPDLRRMDGNDHHSTSAVPLLAGSLQLPGEQRPVAVAFVPSPWSPA